MRWLLLALIGCTSSPDFVGTYAITAHTWIAEIEVSPNKLDCSAAGSPSTDGEQYFAFVTDSAHASAVQYLGCVDVANCSAPMTDYAWFDVDGHHGVDASADVVNSEFDPPYCDDNLETFDVADISADSIHIDLRARRATGDVTNCSIDQARALETEPDCIWVERIDGRRVK